MTAEPKSPDEFPVLASGQVISQYRLIEEVGHGGIGVVWKALDTRLERLVALKTLRPASSGDGESGEEEDGGGGRFRQIVGRERGRTDQYGRLSEPFQPVQ